MQKRSNSLPILALATICCGLGYCVLNPSDNLSNSELNTTKTHFESIVSPTSDSVTLVQPRILPQLDISTVKVGQTIRLDKVYFEADSNVLNSESSAALDEVFEFMEKNKNVSIEIGGHTNNLPKDGYCDTLSTSRAKAVATFLHNKGIHTERISYKGYGKRNPIASNDSKEGRKKNQRVEIKILQLNGEGESEAVSDNKMEKLYKDKSYDKLFILLNAKTENEISPREMGMLGFLYLHGYGVKQNLLTARNWLEKGRNSGDDNSTCLLGYIYEKGLGTQQNLRRAHHLYALSADSGFPLAMNNLGYLYEQGLGVSVDLDKAFYYYSKASELEDHMGLNNAGFALLHGIGTPQNIDKGIKFLERSAEKGNIRAMNNLGDLYDNGVVIERDAELSSFWKTKGDSLKNAIHYYSRN